MKQKRAHILQALLASIVLMVSTGCTQDQAGGIRYGSGANRGNTGQTSDPLGNKGGRQFGAGNPFFNNNAGNANTNPQPQDPTAALEQAKKLKEERMKRQAELLASGQLVTASPLSPAEFCKQVRQADASNAVIDSLWSDIEPLENDGIKDACEALIMKTRYNNNDTTMIEIKDPESKGNFLEVLSHDVKDEYLAIHPNRINGFLVGAVQFPEGKKGFKKMRKGIKNPPFAGLFTSQKKEKENLDEADTKKAKAKATVADQENQERVAQIFHRMQNNYKRNSRLGENEAPEITLPSGVTVKVPYSREYFDLLFALKNKGEGDTPAYRRIFHGAVVDSQGNDDVPVEEILPTKDGLMGKRPVPVPVVDSKAWPVVDPTVADIAANRDTAIVRGGTIEPIPAPSSKVMSLARISGLRKEINSWREQGSFQVAFESNILLPEGAELAIGFLSTDTKSGRQIVGNAQLTGTFTTIVNGQTILVTSGTVQDGQTQNINSELRAVVPEPRPGCKTSHMVINYVSNDEDFNTENNIVPLSESVFYKLPNEERWKPLHAGMASVYPIAERKGVTCVPEQERFFVAEKVVKANDDTDLDPITENREITQYHGDKFLHILKPNVDDAGSIRIPIYLYGTNEDLPSPEYIDVVQAKQSSGSGVRGIQTSSEFGQPLNGQLAEKESENRLVITVTNCDQVNSSKGIVSELRQANGGKLTNENQGVQSYELIVQPDQICRDTEFAIEKLELKSNRIDDHKWEGYKAIRAVQPGV
jgi:hypothetical protein